MADIVKQLYAARHNLLDLTMRNRLLNFRPTKLKTIPLLDIIPREVYESLVLREKTMEFLAKPVVPTAHSTGTSEGQELDEGVEAPAASTARDDALPPQPPPPWETAQAERSADRFLRTTFASDELQKRLFSLYHQARSVLEEQGHTILYLALGFLEWMESPSVLQGKRAPLILLPTELERTKVSASFKLRWTGEDLLPNTSLQAKLAEQGIVLPEFEMPDDKWGIDQYLQAIATSIAPMPQWRVVTDCYLDFFSFTKFVMYRDLDPAAWPAGQTPAEHPLIQALLDPPARTQHDAGFMESEVDEKLTTRDVHHVLDADSSQIAALEDVKQGWNLVVEGPPGTGKSQTIANMIAELLAAGKSVLFVSEKMAALEVVKSRLDRVGLGDFCLELHSRMSTKKAVLRELERTIAAPIPHIVIPDEQFEHVEALKATLNGYAQALREPFGQFQRSPFALFCLQEAARRHFATTGRTLPRVPVSGPEHYDQAAWVRATTHLRTVVDVLPLVRPLAKHPWRGCTPGTVLPSDEEEIRHLLDAVRAALSALDTAVAHLAEGCAIQRPLTLADLPQSIAAANVLKVSQPVDRDVLLNTAWNKPNAEAEQLIHTVEAVQTSLAGAMVKFHPQALERDIATMCETYKALSGHFFRCLNRQYRSLKRDITTLYKGKAPRRAAAMVRDLEGLTACLKLRDEVRGLDQTGHALFGSHWCSEESDVHRLRAFATWVVSFRRHLLDQVLSERAVDLVSTGIAQEHLEHMMHDMEAAAHRFYTHRDALAARIGANYHAMFGMDPDHVSFAAWHACLEQWHANLPRLQRWGQFVAVRDTCCPIVGESVMTAIEDDVLEPDDVLPCFEGNLANALLHRAFQARPPLAHFIGDLHEQHIQQFMALDRASITWHRQRVVSKLAQNRPRLTGGASAGSEAGVLLGEFTRKRGHMSIRKLMSLAGGLIQKIKPCFMMSPLSIAQFLDPRTARFDVIIFDEASQVRPEDALGAFLRGNQVVVIGDTRQLPPTSFFDRMIEADEDEEQELTASVADMESILHQCKRSFPSKTLRWHYRSKHESLIAVSNQEFYDNQLLIYPSAIDRATHLGLQFVHLPQTLYDRGRSAVNREEAKAVARAVMEHYQQFPDKSLGVGTFSMKQQHAIVEEIELQRRTHPDMEDFFADAREEHFFVKNLETIQGDERDVIFLSMGYGFDQSRRLSQNFGPLNREGGERRLNVLMTRARERCVVFSNFRASDLSLESTAPFGVRALKIFLEYAEHRHLHSMEATSDDTDSPFEDAVYEFLRSHSYEVRKQIGCAGFRIDLAVVDPELPGRYLLGIECDGAQYHSSSVARDRDRLREQILKDLGWRIHRIWSTDWYRNRPASESRLLDAIEQAQQEGHIAVETEAPLLPLPAQEAFPRLENQEHEHPSASNETLETKATNYEVCTALGIAREGELHEQSVHHLAQAIRQVVESEGPIHVEEVVRRIRTLWGLGRAGKRIRDALGKATVTAQAQGYIRQRGDFLWPAGEREIPVRRRGGDVPAKIELICDEEITEAMKLVLKAQYATVPEDLMTVAAKLLGLRVITSAVIERIQTIMHGLMEREVLQQMPNGMIQLTQS
jgi:very-short-patch-repair endonuclease